MNRLILLVESRIRGDVYVRFGGELPKTHRSNTAGRWMLSLPFLDAILIERGHELFYEGNRKIDLIRFNKYAQEMYKAKGVMPTHQYMPIPNYAVEQAVSYGKELKQTWERPGWAEDKSKAQQSIN